MAGLAGAAALQLGYGRAALVVWLVATVAVAPLALRRRLPLAVCLAVLAADVGLWLLGWHLIGNAPVALAIYSAARYVRWPRSLVALVAAEAWVRRRASGGQHQPLVGRARDRAGGGRDLGDRRDRAA